MANMLFANNCNTTLNGGITAVATSMIVTSATGFPAPTGSQYFYCTLADAATQTTIEIVKVTAVSGTTFTIVRGQDGTSGTIFASGAVVSLRLVRASLNDFPKLDEANTFTGLLTANSFASSSATITGGTLNGVAIGGTTAGDGTFDILTANVTRLTNVTSSAGIVITGTFTGSSPTDGLVMDYATGWGRFSDFGGDGFQWYNGGLATTKLMELSSTGALSTTGTVTANGVLLTGNTGTVTSVTGTAPIVSSGGTTPAISMAAATTSVNGYLTSTDWTTFNGKQAALISGTNIKTVSGVSLLGSGDVGTIGTGYGGTGLTTFTSGGVVYASSTSALATGGALTFDGANLVVGGNVTNNSVGTNSAGFLGTSGTSFRFSLTRQDAIAAASLYINAFGGIGFATGLGGGGSASSAPNVYIDNSGNLLVGQTATTVSGLGNCIATPNGIYSGNGTTSGYSNSTSANIEGASGRFIANHANGASSGSLYIGFGYNNGGIGSITQAGTTGVLYNITSDYRLKDVVSTISDSGSRIDALQPINYTMKADGSQHRGFLAHKFQEVYPNSVSGEKDAVNAEGKPVYQGMQASSSDVMADLIAEIQSLRKRVAQLEGTANSSGTINVH